MTLEQFEQFYADFLMSLETNPGQFEESWPRMDCRYICDGEGCPQSVDWIEFRVSVPTDGVWKIWCAPCSKPIMEIDPMLSDAPNYRLRVHYDDENGNPTIPWGS